MTQASRPSTGGSNSGLDQAVRAFASTNCLLLLAGHARSVAHYECSQSGAAFCLITLFLRGVLIELVRPLFSTCVFISAHVVKVVLAPRVPIQSDCPPGQPTCCAKSLRGMTVPQASADMTCNAIHGSNAAFCPSRSGVACSRQVARAVCSVHSKACTRAIVAAEATAWVWALGRCGVRGRWSLFEYLQPLCLVQSFRDPLLPTAL